MEEIKEIATGKRLAKKTIENVDGMTFLSERMTSG
jgi:hypothetical protein